MDVLFTQAKQYLSKTTAAHYSTLHTKIANQNVLKRIPIATNRKNPKWHNKVTKATQC